ncbi:hypothetical protein E2C01_052550 [Portunus trituberculatus]|uniref:Uncharacterized protein n=1 Tax=Portunus trituberculatus TaxID=210409 RepID=A0A5B7GPN6_PORTR|nr:hypothetical protein [Portunus trituberculatus]
MVPQNESSMFLRRNIIKRDDRNCCECCSKGGRVDVAFHEHLRRGIKRECSVCVLLRRVSSTSVEQS